MGSEKGHGGLCGRLKSRKLHTYLDALVKFCVMTMKIPELEMRIWTIHFSLLRNLFTQSCWIKLVVFKLFPPTTLLSEPWSCEWEPTQTGVSEFLPFFAWLLTYPPDRKKALLPLLPAISSTNVMSTFVLGMNDFSASRRPHPAASLGTAAESAGSDL